MKREGKRRSERLACDPFGFCALPHAAVTTRFHRDISRKFATHREARGVGAAAR